ncbi:DUF6973 domain-containing protein [Lachnobacterium bovis]|uniref:DUF6973 domain-containing protein n=1 Tax=Lachnobacterium bovis TaxID=140626 RepID=UPI0003B68CE6|nr:hypothetical protein [Lachnobacterium bovis]
MFHPNLAWIEVKEVFRHCLWNALMKQSIGSSAAEQWATAHEYNSSGIDKTMDLHNNRDGDLFRSLFLSLQGREE